MAVRLKIGMPSFEQLFSGESALFAVEVLIKMGLGVLLGGAVGWERERSGRPAGVRTHMLICLGVVLFGEVSRSFSGGDPSRIAANVVTGVGFLGAGTILRMGVEIRGLTTAASIWAVAAIGLAVSAGGSFFIVAVAATVLVLLTLTFIDWLLERTKPAVRGGRELIVSATGTECLSALITAIEGVGTRVNAVRVNRLVMSVQLTLDLEGPREGVLAEATGIEGVESAAWSD